MLAYAGVTCQWLLAAVFLVAAGSKLSSHMYREFVASTGRLLPTRWNKAGWARTTR